MNEDDILSFDDEVPVQKANKEYEAVWPVLVVDDDPEVHAVTALALKGFTYAGKKLRIDSAYSAEEAREMLAGNVLGYAIALLDVVMESDHAGLELARWIREDLQDPYVRLILRTGQPGQAPEREVITNYDINDYKEKTELTANKLYTLICASLRSYRDMIALFRNKVGLESIIHSTAQIFSHQSLNEFTQGALQQISALLYLDQGAVYSELNTLAAMSTRETNTIIAATGRFSHTISQTLESALNKQEQETLNKIIEEGGQAFGKDYFIGVYNSRVGRKHVLFLEGFQEISELDRQLIQVFGQNIGVAFDNQCMSEEVELTQREIVYRMSEAVENRSKETGNHVKRMALTSKILGKAYGLNHHDVEILYKAAPLHDIGKIAIPDHILNKPGKLTPEEWEVMKTHAQIGHDILASSELEVLRAGAIISVGHHENWDGSGYPRGVAGENIPIFARIAALADVFDALINKRSYKQAWNIEDVRSFFVEMKGVKFQPELVDLLFDNEAELLDIQRAFPD